MSDASMQLTIGEDGIAHLELSNPGNRNAMDPAFVDTIAVLLDEIEAHGGVRTLLVTAQGSSFSVGGDMKFFAGRTETLEAEFGYMVDHWHEALTRLAQVPFPVVTAVHGGTAGGGLGLLWIADYVIAAQNTKIATGFADLGISGDGGSSWYLPRFVGLRRAQEMIMDNRVLDAPTALDWGLVNRVVSEPELADAARAAAERFAKRSATAMSHDKKLMVASYLDGYSEHLLREAAFLKECVAGSDIRAGLKAFVAKTTPAFTDSY